MIYLKVHDTEKGRIIAMCDEELLGRIFNEGKRELNLRTYSEFYKGELVDEGYIQRVIGAGDLYSANVVGKKSVDLFVMKKIIKKEQVKKVAGVPFVQVYMID